MRRSAPLLLTAALVACGGPSLPTGYGVNLSLSLGRIPTATRDRIDQLELRVLGSERFVGRTATGDAARSGEIRVRYIPGVAMGDLSFVAQLFEGELALARGSSGQVALLPGKAQSLRFELEPVTEPADGGAMVDASVGPDAGGTDAGAVDLASPTDSGGDALPSGDGGVVGYQGCGGGLCTCPASQTCSGQVATGVNVVCAMGSMCSASLPGPPGTAICESTADCDFTMGANGTLHCAMGSTCNARCPTPPCTIDCKGTCQVYCGIKAKITVSSVTVNCT